MYIVSININVVYVIYSININFLFISFLKHVPAACASPLVILYVRKMSGKFEKVFMFEIYWHPQKSATKSSLTEKTPSHWITDEKHKCELDLLLYSNYIITAIHLP